MKKGVAAWVLIIIIFSVGVGVISVLTVANYTFQPSKGSATIGGVGGFLCNIFISPHQCPNGYIYSKSSCACLPNGTVTASTTTTTKEHTSS